ncbi:MAG: hypothetical protein JSW00_01485 [Thermoplasmata archaeon]|nr:MAG: hypothetical protein JSW00_01485 [Thermoplasmata archaeon]
MKMAFCPNCGREMGYIAQHGQWYCYSCRQYRQVPQQAAPIAPQQQYQPPQQAPPGKSNTVLIMGAVIAVVAVVIIASLALMLGGDGGGGGSNNKDKDDKARTLELTIHYTGSGTVDSDYKIFIGVLDEADFRGEYPEHTESLSSSSGTVTISGITFSPCYVFVSYDADGSGGDPDYGDSYEIYEDESMYEIPADPIDIEEGETKSITITFDDSYTIDW